MGFVNNFFSLVVVLLLTTATTSCEKDTPKETLFISSALVLKIKNSNNENFLNTINTNDIKLYYKDNGVLKLMFNGSDYPNSYYVFEDTPGEKMIKLFCYIEGVNNFEETYVKWNSTDMDTISYSITRYSSGSKSINFNTLRYNDTPLELGNNISYYDLVKQ